MSGQCTLAGKPEGRSVLVHLAHNRACSLHKLSLKVYLYSDKRNVVPPELHSDGLKLRLHAFGADAQVGRAAGSCI